MSKTDIIIIGAGPVGLFTVFEAGLLGLNCTLIDNLDKPGGQCAELYPEKPIYDIPGVPFQTAQDHVNALLEQIKPFDYKLHLSERVDSIREVDIDNDKYWEVITTKDNKLLSKNIFIAAGAGSFEPRRPPNIDNPDKFVNKGVEYAVRSVEKYENKDVFIFGGGDSALDWTVELSKIAKSISLVHRRDAFRGAQHTEEQMRKLVSKKKVKLLTPYLINSIEGNEKVNSVTLKNFDTNEIESHKADELLFLFGLNKKLGPILEWGIDLNEKKIKVNTEDFQTNKDGIFAVGDINDYPGKLDLILSGFHETTLAVQKAYKRIYPGERVPFGYTTSNSKLQEKLGVKNRFRKYLPVVVDLETGGFDPEINAILEIAITLINEDCGELCVGETHRYHIEPFQGSIVEAESLEFTKINLDHPLRNAVSETEAIQDLFKIINKTKNKYECSRAILVGHNAHFDHSFLKKAVERNNIKKSPFHSFSVFDTVSLGALETNQTVLAKICESLGIDYDSKEAHSAAYDSEVTAKVFCKIINKYQ